MKIVVEAKVRLDPAMREQALEQAKPWVDGARAERGCLGYAWTADLHEPGLVRVYEEWADETTLAEHLAGPQYRGMLDHLSDFGIKEAASRKFAIAREAPVYNAEGVATADFD